MSQIKLRRDTYANFTASNPVLGSGEPAYETDTKKLKIGDGSTAYTQLDYFSSGGGGGSVDITATLPLKIDENGVISLEVDGQTIQIVDGKLHANTDELGNEVNDLSGRVTANEADILTIQGDITDLSGQLDGKEDKITATEPLSLISSTLDLNHGMTLTSDGTGFYSSTACYPDDIGRYGRVYITYNDKEKNGPQAFYIMPYQLGQIIKYPIRTSTESSVDHLFLANISSDENIDLISNTYSINISSDNGFIEKGAIFSRSGSGSGHYTYSVDKFVFRGGTGSSDKTPTGIPANTAYSQIYLKDGVLYAEKAIKRGDGYEYARRVAYSNTSHIERLSQINAILIPQGTGSTDITESNAMKFANYGIYSELDSSNSLVSIYDYTGNLGDFVSSKDNLWKPNEALVSNALQLNIGDGLSVTDGKLTATAQTPSLATASTAGIVKPDGTTITITDDGTISSVGGGSSTPDNMVTTDTDQTISGSKTIDKLIIPQTLIQKGIFIEGQTDPSIYAYGDKLGFLNVGNFSATSLEATGRDNVLTLGGYSYTSGDYRISCKGQNSAGMTYLHTILSFNIGNRILYVGNNEHVTRINGSSIIDVNDKKFLTQGNVTAGDNISIENTDTGIKISSTASGGGITVPGTTYQDLSSMSTLDTFYKSPGNGYITGSFNSSSGNQFCRISVWNSTTDENPILCMNSFSSASNNTMEIICPINKDQYYKYQCNTNAPTKCKFVPLVNK